MSQATKKPNAAVVLTVIAVVAALVLALTNAVTAGPIREHEEAALRAAYGRVMPLEEGGSYAQVTEGLDGYNINSLYQAKNAAGEVVGYCVTAAKKGYGGQVSVTLGVDAKGKVTGAVISAANETAGLGSRVQDEGFTSQFADISGIDGGCVEKISGATISSTAALNAANEALRCVAEVGLGHPVETGALLSFGAKAAPAVDTSALKPGATMQGKAEGFGGAEVTVTYVLSDDLTIASLDIDASSQTAGFGQRCAEDEAFLAAIIGQAMPVSVDALSNATITSEAIEKAINGAVEVEPVSIDFSSAKTLAQKDGVTVGELQGNVILVPAEDTTGDVTVTVKVDGGKVVSAAFTEIVDPYAGQEAGAPEKAQAAGFGGEPVFVTVTRYADGAIASLKVDASLQLQGIGLVCEKEAFTSQFIGKKGPFTLNADIDSCAGATFTSQGVVDAVNAICATPVATAAEAAPAVEEPAAPAPEAVGEPVKAQAAGFGGEPVFVTVGFAADGAIATLKVDASLQLQGIGLVCEKEAFTSQFIGKKGPFTLNADIDSCSGATFTSQGVVDAVNAAIAAREAAAAAPAVEEAAAPQVVGEPVKGQAAGFGGEPVFVTVGLDADGAIASLKVDASTQMAGIGLVCEKEDFTKQFIGKKGPFTLNADIDSCAGATFTSQGVVDAVNAIMGAPAVDEPAAPVAEEAAPPQVVGGPVKGQAAGFGGEPVFVTVGLDAEGAIASLKVDASTQMAGIGLVCEKEDFTKQFIGKKGPFTLNADIDSCAGATFTSQGVVDAVNAIMAAAAPAAPVAEEAATPAELASEPVKSQANGFGGEPVFITVVMAADGTIAVLTVDASTQMAGIGLVCEKEDFTSQFIGKKGPFTLNTDIDSCAGATFTSQGVVDAVNALFQ